MIIVADLRTLAHRSPRRDEPLAPAPAVAGRRHERRRFRSTHPLPDRMNPKLILADEPTANLDTENGKQVMDIIKRLNKETGVTFVFATHDPRVIGYAERVVTLQDGLIVKDSAAH